MTDQVAERLAQRAALASGIGDDQELLDLLAPTVERTAENLKGKYTVPELKAKAEEHNIDLDGASLKDDIATEIAKNVLAVDEAQAEAEAEPELMTGEGEPVEAQAEPEPQAEEVEAEDVEIKAAEPEQKTDFDMIDEMRPLAGGGRYVKVLHKTRILTPYGQGDGRAFLDPYQAEEELSKPFQDGYDLLFVEHLGIDPRGHMILWGFGLPNDPEQGQGYNEVKHIVRVIGQSEGAITGFQADEYITSYLADGWELYKVKQVGMSPSGINVLWVLVR